MAGGEDLMRSAEVAAAFGVCTKAVNRWGREGKLRAVRTPIGHMRFHESEVRALAAAAVVRRVTTADLPAGGRTPEP